MPSAGRKLGANVGLSGLERSCGLFNPHANGKSFGRRVNALWAR